MRKDAHTTGENRWISPEELAVVDWLVRNVKPEGSLEHLLTSLPALRVVGGCDCGCASVDFEEGGQCLPSSPIVDAIGKSTEGVGLLVMLWGREDAVTGLEVVGTERGSARILPDPASLTVW